MYRHYKTNNIECFYQQNDGEREAKKGIKTIFYDQPNNQSRYKLIHTPEPNPSDMKTLGGPIWRLLAGVII